MKRYFAAAPATLVLAFATFVGAQSTTQDRPAGMDQMKGENTRVVSVEGCLVHERDVPGRNPNIAERAAKPTGMFQDYILTQVKFLKGEPEGMVGTSGSDAAGGQMFEIRGIEGDQLKNLAGQRVRIEGRLDPNDLVERNRTQAKEGMSSANDLPEIHGTTITKATGECKPIK